MIQKERKLVKRRKLQYSGHIFRGPEDRVLRLVIQGKLEGTRQSCRIRRLDCERLYSGLDFIMLKLIYNWTY